MTSNVELLPLPKHSGKATDMFGQKTKLYSGIQMQDYALANVLHHTAPLRYALDNAARDIKMLRGVRDAHAAEIEALRAEREVICAEAVKYADKSGRLEAKVDRLADGLREITELRERHHDNLHDAVTIAEEALRDSEAASG